MSFIHTYFPHITWPFSRVFGRGAQIFAAFFLYQQRRHFKLGELREYFSARFVAIKLSRLAVGFLLSAGSIALVIPYLVSSGVLAWSNQEPSYLLGKLGAALVAALVISILEETFFRLLLFRGLAKRIHAIQAALVTSILYASVHFIAPVREFKYETFDAFAGLTYLGQVFSRFARPDIYPALFALFLVGMLLCYVMQRSSSLFLCIGLHAGWVTGLKMLKALTTIADPTRIPDDLGGRYFLLSVPPAWVSIIAIGLILALLFEKCGLAKQDERGPAREESPVIAS